MAADAAQIPPSLLANPLPNPYGIGPGEIHTSTLDLDVPKTARAAAAQGAPAKASSSPTPRARASSPIPPAVQQEIYHEADARFWAQTGYKPGISLDPSNPADKHWLPVYYGIGNKVEAEWRSGALKDPNSPGWTYKHPAVQQALTQASASSDATVKHMAAAQEATAKGDHAIAATHADQAHAAHTETVRATRQAAAYQPPSVSPRHVRHAWHHVMHFHMNAAGVGELDPADAAAAMQTADAPAAAAANAAPGSEPDPGPDASGSTAIVTSPEVRGLSATWSATPTAVKVGVGVVGALGLAVLAAKTVGERRRF